MSHDFHATALQKLHKLLTPLIPGLRQGHILLEEVNPYPQPGVTAEMAREAGIIFFVDITLDIPQLGFEKSRVIQEALFESSDVGVTYNGQNYFCFRSDMRELSRIREKAFAERVDRYAKERRGQAAGYLLQLLKRSIQEDVPRYAELVAHGAFLSLSLTLDVRFHPQKAREELVMTVEGERPLGSAVFGRVASLLEAAVGRFVNHELDMPSGGTEAFSMRLYPSSFAYIDGGYMEVDPISVGEMIEAIADARGKDVPRR